MQSGTATDDLFSLKKIDLIVKEAESMTYPPEDFHTVVQERVPLSTPFPCEVAENRPKWRSDTKPTSVHKLRPGDIDVVSAMGDSIASGNAARERSTWGLIISDRGVVFSGGGQATWREITTLPNIIKVFNPKLVGQALGRGDFFSYNAQLNVAVPGSLDSEIIHQVKMFIFKMRRDRRIDFERDWKLVTMFIGHNNICTYECNDKEKNSPEIHKAHLQKALDYLYDNVPRVFVNIINILDPTIQLKLPISLTCQFLSRAFCACMYSANDVKESMLRLSRVVRSYQKAEEELVFSGRYDGREYFTVELQPFSRVLNGPIEEGEAESPVLKELIQNISTIWTPDCHHLSQRGNAEVAIQLWNNMLQPVGNKTEKIEDVRLKQYLCPTEEKPYFFTKKNSEIFLKEGHQ
ncbi:phospholipase B1, membrane-associated-like [Ischnura elegans]|uniref:phospholipase B1, membrane-associated-like n=1 Tax=Ischnura elegans TaxID=197161 RepID=UPI001ED8B622|nr:phospholipase B1, membrane-associated-like [Ischnura elegans]